VKLGKVIGNVVASVKDQGLEGLRLLIVQGLDDDFKPKGKPYVAADGIYTAGPGDIVYVVSKKEAAIAISKGLVPIDECIVGFVDEYNVVKTRKKRPRKKKLEPTKELDHDLADKEKTKQPETSPTGDIKREPATTTTTRTTTRKRKSSYSKRRRA